MRRYILIAAALLWACGGTTTLETTSGTGGTGGSGGGETVPEECKDPSKWIDPPFAITFESGSPTWLYADETSVEACQQYLAAACKFAAMCPMQMAQLHCKAADGSFETAFSCSSILKEDGENVQDAAFNNLSPGLDCGMEFVPALPGEDPCLDGAGGGGAGGHRSGG